MCRSPRRTLLLPLTIWPRLRRTRAIARRSVRSPASWATQVASCC
jgi:hypothetical protein